MGAIGSFYASKLSRSKVELSCVLRSDFNHVSKHGIKVIHNDGSQSVYQPDYCYGSIKDIQNKLFDYIIIATKTVENKTLVQQLQPILKNKPILVLLQNGLYIETLFKQQFNKLTLISGLAFICVTKIGAGVVHHMDYGRLIVGNYPNGSTKEVSGFIDMFDNQPNLIQSTENIQLERYKKLVWNAAFNPLSVIYNGLNTQQILQNSTIKKQVKLIMQDIQKLAAADGYMIDGSVIDKNIEDTKKMQPYKTSMCIDWENNRPLEIEAILGNALTRAKLLNCQLTQLSTLYQQLSRFIND